MNRGLEVKCISRWGTATNEVLRLVHREGDFLICWRDAQLQLGMSISWLLNATLGVHVHDTIGDPSPYLLTESQAFALIFKQSFIMQFEAFDHATADALCECLMMLSEGNCLPQ